MTSIRWRKLPATTLGRDSGLQRQWDDLNEAGLRLPFLSADAVGTAIDIFGTGKEQLLVGSLGEQPVAMLVLVPDGALRWRSFQPSQLPLGAWVVTGAVTPADVCRSLLRGPLGLCLAVTLTEADPLMAAREADAGDTEHADFVNTAWVNVEGDFETYWNTRGKNLRQNMRKQRNKLASEGTRTTLRRLTAEADMDGAIQRYGELESRGWKAGQGTAIHPDNDQGRFYTRILLNAARRGEALVFEYLFDDRTAAMDLGLLRGGMLVVLKTTYDESIPKALSPAALLREEELQFIFSGDSGIRRIEYYGRVMEWHTKLTEQSRMLYHLSVYRWPWVKSLAQRRRRTAAEEPPAAAADADA